VSKTSIRRLQGLRPMGKKTLAHRVSEAIKAFILSEHLEPGSKLPTERQLAEALGVSRNVVREGLSALVIEGIIVKNPGSGIFLRSIDIDSLSQVGERVLNEEKARYEGIREARAAVEVGAIGIIVERITEEELQQLEEIELAFERRMQRGESFWNEDMKFHLTLLRAARNELLLQWTPLVEEVMRVWAYQTDDMELAFKAPAPDGEGGRVAAEHRAILNAIRSRDAHRARELLRTHFRIEGL